MSTHEALVPVQKDETVLIPVHHCHGILEAGIHASGSSPADAITRRSVRNAQSIRIAMEAEKVGIATVKTVYLALTA